MQESTDNSKNEDQKQVNGKKSTLKILEEVDKQVIKDLPPNFNSYIYTRIHEDPEGKLHE